MSLSYYFFFVAQKEKYAKTNKIKKIKKSLLNNRGLSPQIFDPNNSKKETPFCTSLEASYTIEATIIFPIYLSFLLFFLFFIQLFSIEIEVQKELNQTCQIAAVYAKEETDRNYLYALEGRIKANLMQKDLPKGFISGSLLGISFHESKVDDNYIDLIVSYYVTSPITFFGHKGFYVNQRARCRKWVGWDPLEELGEQYVYVTSKGSVYHTSYHCTYLNPSIVACKLAEVDTKRNLQGGKYAPCSLCKGKKTDGEYVYITNYGDVYHKSITCKALKRTIQRIKIEDVGSRKKCSKCSRQGG